MSEYNIPVPWCVSRMMPGYLHLPLKRKPFSSSSYQNRLLPDSCQTLSCAVETPITILAVERRMSTDFLHTFSEDILKCNQSLCLQGLKNCHHLFWILPQKECDLLDTPRAIYQQKHTSMCVIQRRKLTIEPSANWYVF